MHPDGIRDHLVWIASVLAFTIAAATGALYRFGLAYGFTGGLDFTNVRHAHSHLMFFAWVTPAVFMFISRRVEALTTSSWPRLGQWATVAALVLGFASYVPFLLFGYSPVSLGSIVLPPSVIVAGLNMIAWYAFMAGYVRQTRKIKRGRVLILFDGALMFLFLASLGAWGISLTVPTGNDSPLISAALTHLFLGFFSEGFILLAVLGLAESFTRPGVFGNRLFETCVWLLIAGISVTFLLGMPSAMVDPSARWLVRIASGFMAVGLTGFSVQMLRRGAHSWRIVGVFLVLKAVGFYAVLLTPGMWWSDYAAERVLYFHLHLLGFTSLGIMAAARETVAGRTPDQIRWMTGAVVLVVLSLLPMTMFWPGPLKGAWMLKAAAWAALGPVLVGFWMVLFQRPALKKP